MKPTLSEQDQKLFTDLKEKLPYEGDAFMMIKEYGLYSGYEEGHYNQIYIFFYFCNSPNNHFIDDELRQLQEHLSRHLSKILDLACKYCEPQGSLYKISKNHMDKKEKFNKEANEIVSTYTALIKKGKDKIAMKEQANKGSPEIQIIGDYNQVQNDTSHSTQVINIADHQLTDLIERLRQEIEELIGKGEANKKNLDIVNAIEEEAKKPKLQKPVIIAFLDAFKSLKYIPSAVAIIKRYIEDLN